MIKKDINIKTPDGIMNTFVVYPDEGGPFPLVLFLMDAPGKREELHDMATRLSTCGYYVVLPNLYYRRTKDFILDRTPQENREKMYEHMCRRDSQIETFDDMNRLMWEYEKGYFKNEFYRDDD